MVGWKENVSKIQTHHFQHVVGHNGMKNLITIIISVLIWSSCSQKGSDLEGTWISTNLSYYETMTFYDSIVINKCRFCANDSLLYFIKNDSLVFPPNQFNDEVTKYGFRISKDTFWLSFKFESEVNYLKYVKKKSDYIIDDIKLYHGFDLDLPNGYSEPIGLTFSNSIFFPKQDSKYGKYLIYLNNDLIKLDTVFYKKLIELQELGTLYKRDEIGLYIDTEVDYKAFKLLKDQLRKAKCHSVIFISDPSEEEFYCSTVGLRRKFPPIWFGIPDSIPDDIDLCNIRISDNEIFLDEELFDLRSFYKKMEEKLPFVTYIEIDDLSSYGTYYKFISKHDSLKSKIQNDRSIKHFNLEYNALIDRKNIKFIDSLTRINFVER